MNEVIAYCKSKTAFVVDKVRPVLLANKNKVTSFDWLDFDLFSDPDRYYPQYYLDTLSLTVEDVKIRYINFLKSARKLKYGN